MIITNIETQKNKNRVNIYIDNEFAFGLDKEIAYKHNLSIGYELQKDYIDNLLKAEERNKVINSALGYLSYRQQSEKELTQKLKSKGYCESDIDLALEYCKSKNYINDKEFAISFIRDKTNLNKYGTTRIRYELLKKGVHRSIIDEVLDLDFDQEYGMALQLGIKRLANYKPDDKNGKYRKLSAYLQRKGYSYEIISRVLKEIIN